MELEIHHHVDRDRGRYTLYVDGAPVGELDHHDRAGVRAFTHTGVRSAYRHHGLAADLVRRGLDDARRDGLLVDPVCSYVARYLEDHPEDADLLG